MSLADPDALECRLCAAEFVGPDRREQYRAHRQEQHPAGETPPLATPVNVTPAPPADVDLPVAPKPFACSCGRRFATAHQRGGHVGVRKTYPDGRSHAAVGAAPKVSGQAVGKTAITSSTARGSTPAAVPPPDPAPTSDGELVRPAPDVSPVTLTGGTVTFQVSVDLSALPGSLDAVVGALRAALAGLGR